MGNEKLMNLLQVEAGVLFEPFVAFFDVWDKHAVMSASGRRRKLAHRWM